MKDLPANLTPAPFFAEIAHGPESGLAHWLTTRDGVRIRVGHWRPEGADAAQEEGTVLLFPGRTEYIEKYGPTAAQLTARGYGVVAIDWRGQGLADRSLSERRLGHVERFEDFQLDVDALLAYAEALDCPKPFYLLAHSMGGQIGLRALMQGLDVAACVFTGPMWGIRIPPRMRVLARLLSYLAPPLGLAHQRVPTTTIEQYVQVTGFADNMLTNDADTYAFLQMQIKQQPDLVLGGPTIRWLTQALADCSAIAKQPSPDIPCLTFLGSDEEIVDTDAIRARMAKWPNGRLEIVPEGRHEILMGDPVTQTRTHEAMAAHFHAARSDGRKR